MDHSLNALLSRASEFEPYVPESKDNLYFSLNLLTQLGEVAQNSIPNEAEPAELSPTPSTQSPNPKDEPSPQPQASSPPSFQPAPRPPQVQNSKLNPIDDRHILQALQSLRESKTFQRKTTGIFSPILRSDELD